jgi:N6-adenosine-specific RNA methylase IME4
MTALVRTIDSNLPRIADLQRELDRATSPAEIVEIAARLDAFEQYMRDSALYSTEDIRPINETRMRARWKLGRALADVDRGQGARTDITSGAIRPKFKTFISGIGLKDTAAKEAQRIGAMPDDELARAFEEARKRDDLLTYTDLLTRALPYWHKANRETKHRAIQAGAVAKMVLATPGPFPLIYADPPWKFEVYSEKGLERAPDQHYPTLTDTEIMNFRVGGALVPQIAHRDAALFLWCTSSNIRRAFEIMEAWDFEYKSQAVWIKDKIGLGLIFRNQHEVLLYGTRGAMPGPQHQPPSVFRLPRGAHSAKPPEIRTAIEAMYPDFDERTRLELFSRGHIGGWTAYGLEAFANEKAMGPSRDRNL